MTYSVKEIFYTLQGEGAHAGRPAVFCRFSGCNLWSGREDMRIEAECKFCDTDFIGTDGPGGGKFQTASGLADAVASAWPDTTQGKPYVVITGGEPLLQLDNDLVSALKQSGFEIAVETNGTLPAPEGIDWICVSPKTLSDLAITRGDELKLVYPQEHLSPDMFDDLCFQNFYLQPMDGPDLAANTAAAVNYCLENPGWQLSIQLHKVLHIQ